MIRRLMAFLRQQQAGSSFIELMVALAITASISLGATVSSAQVLTQTSRNADYTTASRHTLNAVHWVSADVQMAQTIETEGAAGFPLTLTRVTWDNEVYQVVYDLEDGELVRRAYINGEGPYETRVAEYINPDTALTYCATDNGVLSLTITGSVGEGDLVSSVTKVRQITSRPNL
jgi:type II secretory pathway component PulJ